MRLKVAKLLRVLSGKADKIAARLWSHLGPILYIEYAVSTALRDGMKVITVFCRCKRDPPHENA